MSGHSKWSKVKHQKNVTERALERGRGVSGIETIEEVIYEAFGSGGVGIIIEVATDNKQRTVAELKNILERGGGTLASSGSVKHFFQFVGFLEIDQSGKSEDELMEIVINLGAIDFEYRKDGGNIYSEPEMLHKVKEGIEKCGIKISTTELIYRPVNYVVIRSHPEGEKVISLIEKLKEIDDVHRVYTNYQISQ